jgi:RNA polymerase sigma-70 factor (ECF subfamily)
MEHNPGWGPEEAFEDFFARTEPRLRAALTSAYGPDLGREATAEALAWAYEHWNRVRDIEHPAPYLYRVGQSRTRRLRRPWRATSFATTSDSLPDVDPRLEPALAALPERQRVTVLLVHGYDWSHTEVATLLGISPSTVATHAARALKKLRATLEDRSDDRA